MIMLKRVRLVNWYAFSNITAPVGFFTLIAGKNGNGKSVMLDAIKYAVYGDTVFNKSSENKGSRTISSYTRGLLDATAGTYIRPADKVPNVYTHIVQEYYDDVEEKYFLLGTVIETNTANNCQTLRYVADRTSMDQMEHVYRDNERLLPYSATELQKKYGLTMLIREQGLPKFMQMTGLKLNLNQLPSYLRKLRGIMTYDPNAKLDKFIRESVLEERNVDFSKLIEAKENIERLHDTFSMIEDEIKELERILDANDELENETNRLLADDIKIAYRKIKRLKSDLEKEARDKEAAKKAQNEITDRLSVVEMRKDDLNNRLIEAKVNLKQLNSTKMILEEEKHLENITKEKQNLSKEKDRLTAFQDKLNELMNEFYEEGEIPEHKDILASLTTDHYVVHEKESAVSEAKVLLEKIYDSLTETSGLIKKELEKLEDELERQEKILEDNKKHKNSFAQIPDYVGLKNEINQEFRKRNLKTEAKFACEYVLKITDEKWRDSIEAFLGRRRYTILVDPQYYDIADDVLNRSKYRYAHLFNTRLLMEKKIEPESDSVGRFLEIKNTVARKYFDYQLGRMHAVALEEVRNYENAISVEGRVSVSMDSYFLRFDKIRFYYLGQETFALNQKRAQKEIERLNKERKECLFEQTVNAKKRNSFNQARGWFQSYDYDVYKKYQTILQDQQRVEQQIKQLKKALKNDSEYIELSQLVGKLEEENNALTDEYNATMKKNNQLITDIKLLDTKIESQTEDLQTEEKAFCDYKINSYAVVQKAVRDYDKYVEANCSGTGGLLQQETRSRVMRKTEQCKKELLEFQMVYGVKHAGSNLPKGENHREAYAKRKEKIWMDDLQEIREKLDDQTRRYEDIFKNEFVLTILKTCENAMDDLREINRELAKLDFSAKYQFDVHYVKDGSEYAKIIEYAKYLDEREKLGGDASGQMTFDMLTSISDEDGELLEAELKQIINRIIAKNSEEIIAGFADYRNYMNYEILMSNEIYDRAKLSRQTGYNSGAEVQIPYLLILSSALLMIYNQKVNSTRLVFIDEPFVKMDPGNVKRMLKFMKKQNLQVIFCAPDKIESIGNECEVILPVLRKKPEIMQIGVVQFHEDNAYERV